MESITAITQAALRWVAELGAANTLALLVIDALLCVVLAISLWRSRQRQKELAAKLVQEKAEHEAELLHLEHSFEVARSQYEARIGGGKELLLETQQRLHTVEDALQTEQQEHHLAISQRDVAQEKNTRLPELESQLQQARELLDGKSEQVAQAHVDIATLGAQLNQEQQSSIDKLEVLEQARKRLTQEFQNLADRIFHDSSEKLEQRSKQTLETALSPLREQLHRFKRQVEHVYDKETRERLSLLHEVNVLKELNLQMSDDAINLTNALKGDNKAQGNWGEVILERVLEESGLRKGKEYETQLNLKTEEGGQRAPDVVVHLPEGKDIIVDSKVSLLDYERYCSSEDEAEKKKFLQAHLGSVNKHIQSLSVKAYEELEGVRSLDFVFVFIPIEAAFMLAFEHDQALFQQAYDRNVIIAGPTTLLATLRTVQNIWRYERQNKNAEVIARQAGGLHDQFVLVLESLEDMGRHIERTQAAYDSMLNRFTHGRGNLIDRAVKLEKLGAKTRKKLPSSLTAVADTDDSAEVVTLVDESE
ncbi:MAG: DNA recombination protein RmuC [Pseudomonadales bacterium]